MWLMSIKIQSGSGINEEHIKLMIRWNSSNHIPNIRQAIPGIRFISMEPTSSIRLKNIRKRPAQSDPYERITPPSLRKRLEILGLTYLKTRRERGYLIQIYKMMHGLEKVKWPDENKILIPEQNITGRRHPFQLSRERTSGNEPRTNFLINWMETPCTCTLGKLFKSKLDLYLNKVGRNTHIHSYKTALGEADDLISWHWLLQSILTTTNNNNFFISSMNYDFSSKVHLHAWYKKWVQ